MIDTFHIRYCAISNARHEHIPMIVDVTDEIDELRRERYMKFVHISVCKEKETVNDEEGRKVSYGCRCPWCNKSWS